MKKLLSFLLLLAGIANAQMINIPDPVFKALLLASNPSNPNSVAHDFSFELMDVDVNDDGEIDQSEADAVYSIQMYNQEISSLEGINSFTNIRSVACDVSNLSAVNISGLNFLRYLSLNQNLLTSLDVSTLTALDYLSCRNNQLTSLNVLPLVNLAQLLCSGNTIASVDLSTVPNLIMLDMRSNLLTSLDVTPLPLLQYLDCSHNQIGTLDLSNATLLTQLHTENCNLSSIDVSMLSNLQAFLCNGNHFTELDVSALANLTWLACSGNELTTLDCSNNHLLNLLSCQFNQLETLFIKNGSIEADIGNNVFYGNVLQYICADSAQIGPIQAALIATGFTTIMVGSYCSFTPGGDYNTIAGSIKYDFNGNGCDDGDTIPSYLRVNITDGTNTGATFANTNGDYAFMTGAGNFTISSQLENPSYFIISPIATILDFPIVDNSVLNQDFCMSANGVHPDLEIVIVPTIAARPGFNAEYEVVFHNKGTVVTSETVAFSYNDALLTLLSSAPTASTETSGMLTYNFSNLLPFESRKIILSFHVNAPTDTPPVNNGDLLTFSSTINPLAGDELPGDNTFVLDQIVVGSFDPNDITCLEGDSESVTEIGKYLHYNINFENTGTAPAENIIVTAIIDELDFDVNSLLIMDSSHPLQAKISGNTVEFIFAGINLPARVADPIGGHGNVLFKVKTKSDLVAGASVTNNANIYFDYNFPIATNDATTTFELLSNAGFIKDDSVGIYPNPTSGVINIKASNTIMSIELFDVHGRILETMLKNNLSAVIDISAKSSGIYFVKITTEAGSKVEKIIKE